MRAPHWRLLGVHVHADQFPTLQCLRYVGQPDQLVPRQGWVSAGHRALGMDAGQCTVRDCMPISSHQDAAEHFDQEPTSHSHRRIGQKDTFFHNGRGGQPRPEPRGFTKMWRNPSRTSPPHGDTSASGHMTGDHVQADMMQSWLQVRARGHVTFLWSTRAPCTALPGHGRPVPSAARRTTRKVSLMPLSHAPTHRVPGADRRSDKRQSTQKRVSTRLLA
jgi:hypothetical protein